MHRPAFIVCAALAIGCLLAACSVDRHLPQGQSMLVANRVEVTMTDGKPIGKDVGNAVAKRNSYIRQSPNKRLLGFSRLPVYIYCMSNPDKDNWWHRMLRSAGEAPVVYSVDDATRSAKQLQQMMKNKGCFGSRAVFDTLRLHNHKITIRYRIAASPRYRIHSVAYSAQTPAVDSLLRAARGNSLLRAGDCYDQDQIESERTRITTLLQNSGYFTASQQLVHFYVDTTFSDSLLSIDVQVQDPVHDDVATPLETYRIDSIHIDSNAVRSSVVSRALRFSSGNRYNASRIATSYNSLLSLRTFNYIDILVEESPLSAQGNRLLDAHIRLRNSPQQKISVSLELSNASPVSRNANSTTGGNFGLATVLNYQHKNLFGGAEALQIEGNLLGELPKDIFSRQVASFHELFSTFESGLKTTLDLPLFLIPYNSRIRLARTLPHTLFSLSGNYQYRPYFERFAFGTSFGYSWSPSRYTSHQLLPVEMTYVKIQNIDWSYFSAFAGIMGSRIAYQFSDHLIMDLRYDFVYNSQHFGSRDNFSYIHATAEIAGNLLSAFAHAGGRTNELGERLVWDVPYSQYVRFSAEAKQYFYHGRRNTLVLRVIAGLGIPYGNSLLMPYEKGFFGGGPTTLRAWQIRHLGPGAYSPFSDLDYDFDRFGDITLVANVEERFPLPGPLEGALFLDIGNVWTAHRTDAYRDGEFRWNTFARQLATGTGFGLRVKIAILTLRLDFSLPVYDPGRQSDRWRFRHWTFDNIVTNFGIDYPF